MSRGIWIWTAASLSLVAAGFVAPILAGRWRGHLLPGDTSAGHHQIAEVCEACHTPFGGVRQDACTRCHADELLRGADSHGKQKFDDPRNADFLSKVDARRCVTCHREHQRAPMGVTLPAGFCRPCHLGIADERPSHAGLPFESCGDAGCHNYHDNRALHPDFLTRGLDAEPTGRPFVPPRAPHAPGALDAPPEAQDAQAIAEWRGSGHETGGVGCRDCHGASWRARPVGEVCRGCHEAEERGFLGGRHGMRVAAELSPMTPARALLPMRGEAADRALECTTCHGPHRVDTRWAATYACLGCHADRHSLAHRGSPHAVAGVTCATCHLPRREGRAEHNQNETLRPVEKMLDVCLGCHDLRRSLIALAPERGARALEMVRERAEKKKRRP